jgi:carboxymethylenebutenolidase
VKAALPFYGYPPETTEIAGIRCPVLAFYGDLDENLMRSLPALTTAMMDAGIDFTPKVYVGARHAFFNDTNSLTYNGVAATDAWARALAFLDRQLARRA